MPGLASSSPAFEDGGRNQAGFVLRPLLLRIQVAEGIPGGVCHGVASHQPGQTFYRVLPPIERPDGAVDQLSGDSSNRPFRGAFQVLVANF